MDMLGMGTGSHFCKVSRLYLGAQEMLPLSRKKNSKFVFCFYLLAPRLISRPTLARSSIGNRKRIMSVPTKIYFEAKWVINNI